MPLYLCFFTLSRGASVADGYLLNYCFKTLPLTSVGCVSTQNIFKLLQDLFTKGLVLQGGCIEFPLRLSRPSGHSSGQSKAHDRVVRKGDRSCVITEDSVDELSRNVEAVESRLRG